MHLLGLIVLEREGALGMHVLLSRLSRTLDGAIRDDHASPCPTVSHHSQRILANAFHELHIPFRESEHAAVIVVENHHGR